MNFFWSYTKRMLTIKYGYLYNWYAATDSRNIASSEWHVADYVNDYLTLISYLGGASVVGGKLKETGLVHWNTPNTGATNEVGFNARGGGWKDNTNVYGGIMYLTGFWSSAANKVTLRLDHNNTAFTAGVNGVFYACYIRLIKDTTTLTHGQVGTYTGNDGKTYATICIGTQEWLSENLMETKYRDGSAIPEEINNTTWAGLTTGARCSYDNLESNAGS